MIVRVFQRGRVRALRDRDGGADGEGRGGLHTRNRGEEPLERAARVCRRDATRSLDALRAFAGPDWQKAVIEPQEEQMLAQVFCEHYEPIETG
jgi:hypothetical protein